MNEHFIDKFKNIHGDKYKYILKEKINTTSKIDIICHIHGTFNQLVHNHLRGAGCPACGNVKHGLSKRIKLEDFKNKASLIHDNKYIYDLVKFEYNNDLIDIICPAHGVFKQYVSHHYTKQKLGCPSCSFEKSSSQKRLKYDEFVSKLDKDILNNFEFEFSKYKNMNSHIKIKCKTHNIEYDQIAQSFLKGHLGCIKCKCTSLGELKIKSFLDLKNINYIQQHSFDDCKFINKLSFDFYIPKFNICIEFDGIQHFKQLSRSGSDLEIQKKRDKAKNKYCKKHKIKLIRIPYWDSKNIDKFLAKELKNIF